MVFDLTVNLCGPWLSCPLHVFFQNMFEIINHGICFGIYVSKTCRTHKRAIAIEIVLQKEVRVYGCLTKRTYVMFVWFNWSRFYKHPLILEIIAFA